MKKFTVSALIIVLVAAVFSLPAAAGAAGLIKINPTYVGSNDTTREYQTWALATPKIVAGDEAIYTIPSGYTVTSSVLVPTSVSKITFNGTGTLDGNVTLCGVPGVFDGITQGTGTTQNYVYGGNASANSSLASSSITILSGSLRGIIGGSNGANARVTTTNIDFRGGTTNNIWGGWL